MERHIEIDIYATKNGANVYIYDPESGDQTSKEYTDETVSDGSFEKWLVDNVSDWIVWTIEGDE